MLDAQAEVPRELAGVPPVQDLGIVCKVSGQLPEVLVRPWPALVHAINKRAIRRGIHQIAMRNVVPFKIIPGAVGLASEKLNRVLELSVGT